MKKLALIPFVIFLVLLFSCSSDDNPTESTSQQVKPKAPTLKSIELPEKMLQSNDPHAQLAATYISIANAFTTYQGLFTPPEGAKQLPKVNDERRYTWNVGALTITLVYSTDDEYTKWKIIYNGTDPNGTTYVNWVCIEAEQTADGNNGTLIIYQENSTELAAKWTWSNSSDGSSDVTFINYSEDSNWKLDIHSNADKSGEMNIYEEVDGQYVLRYKITWNSDGSGAWWDYETGQSGSWQ